MLTLKNRYFYRIMAASSTGTLLEWYDFSLFAFLMPQLAEQFFPVGSHWGALLLTYGVFAVGFLVRPLGAALFGHWGDRLGRKKTLVLSMVLMSVPTTLIGFLPTYETIGLLSPLLLIVLRLCQGLSVGGESTGAILFVLEREECHYRGFIGACLWAVVGLGLLLGSFAATVIAAHPEYPELWRVPFILGLFTGLVGYFLRKNLPESAAFQALVKHQQVLAFPLKTVCLQYKKPLLVITGLYSLSAMITYLIFIFMPVYAANVGELPFALTSSVSTWALTAVILGVPFSGYLSDKVGRKKCLMVGAVGFFLLSYPLYVLICTGTLPALIIAESVFVGLAILFQGPLSAFVMEQLPMTVRYTAMAVGYNVGYALFGGTAPLIATYLVDATQITAAPGLYLMLGAVLASVVLLFAVCTNIPRAVTTK